MGANFDFDLFAINDKSFGLQIRLPDLLGVALGKADVMAVLFGLFIKIKSLHNQLPILQALTDKINTYGILGKDE